MAEVNNYGILLIIIPIGILASLIAFFVFELKAIKAKREKEKISTQKRTIADIYQKFDDYDTYNNTKYFFVVVYVFTLILASVAYNPSYGLIHALLYIFLTTFLGSIVIFLLKSKKSLVVKVFSGFLYGVPHIFAASLAFLTRYVVS